MSGTPGSCDSSVFSLLRNWYIGVYNGWKCLYFNDWYVCKHSSSSIPLSTYFFVNIFSSGQLLWLKGDENSINFWFAFFWTIFVLLLDICTSFESCVFSPFIYLLGSLLVHLVFNFPSVYMFGVLIFCQTNSCQRFFFPLCRLSLHLVDDFFCCADALQSVATSFVNFCYYYWSY